MFRLNQWLRRSSRGSRRAARGRCPARLELERLDERTLLSAVVLYQVGSAIHEHVFAIGHDGNLYLDDLNGAKGTWQPLGNGGQKLNSAFVPAAINYQVGSVTHEHVFAIGTDGNLYLDDWNGVKWTPWQNLGNAGGGVGAFIVQGPAVINYQVGTVTHENVFVTGFDGNLYLDSWNGAQWTWKPLGNDDGQVIVLSDPAVINYQVGAVTQENVFVTGTDRNGHLNVYLDEWNGDKSAWKNLGHPIAGISAMTGPAVINYQVGTVTHENVFVAAGDLKSDILYLDDWNGATSTWKPLGNDGANILNTPAVINYQVVGSVTHENVFVTGIDGNGDANLYLDDGNGATWTWKNLHNGGQSITSAPAVINYRDRVGAVTHENVFVTGSDGNLYLDQRNGAGTFSLPTWNWKNLGNDGQYLTNLVQPAAGGSAPGLRVAVRAGQGAGVSEPGGSAIQQRLLLEDSPSVVTAANESARRRPAVLGPKNEPDLLGDLWSEDLVGARLDW
jgi:hypothetical protein